MTAHPFSDEDLVLHSEHVLYEIEMFCALADYFEMGKLDKAVAHMPEGGKYARSAAIESFAVHFRQLVDFLSPPAENRRADDVFAVYYAPMWTFERDKWTDDLERVNKYVAHLTMRRALAPEEREFPTRRLRCDLGAELDRFVCQLPASATHMAGFRAAALDVLRIGRQFIGPDENRFGSLQRRGFLYSGGTATYRTEPES